MQPQMDPLSINQIDFVAIKNRQAVKKVKISKNTHKNFAEIIVSLDNSVVKPALGYPGVKELLDIDNIKDENIRHVLKQNI